MISGAVLLLPGLCAGLFMLAALGEHGHLTHGPEIVALCLGFFAVAGVGVLLIVLAARRLQM
jgi:hypothetical protein